MDWPTYFGTQTRPVVSGFINFPLNSKIPKPPLQKGRADVAALTTGGDRILYVKVSFSREKQCSCQSLRGA